MRKKVNLQNKKNPLTYAICDGFESEIRAYVDKTKKETGISKSRIVSNLLMIAIHEKQKNFV